MSFADLAHRPNHEAELDDDYFAEAHEVDFHNRVTMDFRKPDETPITIYVNQDVLPYEPMLARVLAHYAGRFPGRLVDVQRIRSSDLQKCDPSATSTLKKLFLKRGFVSDVDDKFQKGQRTKGIHLREMEAALYLQFAQVMRLVGNPRYLRQDKLAALKRLIGASTRKPDEDIVPGEATHYIAPLIERDLAPAEEVDPNFANGPKAIDRQRVLLPWQPVAADEIVHLAFECDFTRADRLGKSDETDLVSAITADLDAQLAWEARHSEELFRGANRSALLLWQTQVLAFLRIAAHEIEFGASAELLREIEGDPERCVEARDQARQHGMLNVEIPELPAERVLRDRIDRLTDNLSPGDQVLTDPQVRTGLASTQRVIAALHGATAYPKFDPSDRDDYEHPLHWLFPAAEWIGTLKRKRHAHLNVEMARILLAIDQSDRDDETPSPDLWRYKRLVTDRFCGQAWSALITAASGLVGGALTSPIPVVYEWTRDAASPGRADQVDDVLVIHGPLLDFPVSDAATWNQLAQKVTDFPLFAPAD